MRREALGSKLISVALQMTTTFGVSDAFLEIVAEVHACVEELRAAHKELSARVGVTAAFWLLGLT